MTRSWLNFIGGMILLVLLAYGLLPSVVPTAALHNFCTAIQPGDLIEELIEQASMAGNTTKTLDVADTRYLLVMEKKDVSRFVCEVTIKDKNVVSARYVLNNQVVKVEKKDESFVDKK